MIVYKNEHININPFFVLQLALLVRAAVMENLLSDQI